MKNYKEKIKKTCLVAAMLVSPLIADESFGGVGLSIFQTNQGPQIIEILPGTPAAISKLSSGDVIVSVDGESLANKTLEYSKVKLRGQVNKPIEIVFVSNGDTLSTVLRRTQITVSDLENVVVEKWNEGQKEISFQKLDNHVRTVNGDKHLVAILQNGKQISSETSIKPQKMECVFIDQSNKRVPSKNLQQNSSTPSATLIGFSRTMISYKQKTIGTATISILDADGMVVSKIISDYDQPGRYSLNWDLSTLPSGRYLLVIEHNGSVSGNNILLK